MLLVVAVQAGRTTGIVEVALAVEEMQPLTRFGAVAVEAARAFACVATFMRTGRQHCRARATHSGQSGIRQSAVVVDTILCRAAQAVGAGLAFIGPGSTNSAV